MRRVAFLLSLVFVFIIPWEGVVELPGLGTAAKIVGFVVAGFWMVTVVYTRQFRKPGPFHVTFFLFVLWVAASFFWSANPDKTMTQLQTWVQLLVLALILWDLYTTREAVLAGLQAFILGEYVAIGSAVANFFAGNVYYAQYQRFSPSAQSNPDGFGIIVALGIPVAWYLASSESTTRFFRLVNYAYIPAAFLGIALSGTRTALIVSIVGMAFGLASLNRLRPAVRIAIFVLLTSSIVILLPYVQPLRSFQRFSTTTSEITEGDLNTRTILWREGIASFAEHPLIGIGSNMYRSINARGKLAHNSFLSVLVELGLVGFALFVIMLTMAVIQALRQPKWDSRFWLTVLAAWAIGAFTLTYEFRKATWLFLTLVVASAALTSHRYETAAIVRHSEQEAQTMPYSNSSRLPPGEGEAPYFA